MLTIYQWDEISGEAIVCNGGGAFSDPVPQTPVDRDMGWTNDHVIDLPDGTRVVIDSDERGHKTIWVTKEN